jgi:hypothetical protein
VLAVVKQYVKDNPNTTFADLEKIFPDKLQGSYGVVKLESSVSDSDRGIGGKKRYFVKSIDVIKLSASNERVLVSGEWGIGNINRFIANAESLGYKIEKN